MTQSKELKGKLGKWLEWYIAWYVGEVTKYNCGEDEAEASSISKAIEYVEQEANNNNCADGFFSCDDFDEFCEMSGFDFDFRSVDERKEEVLSAWLATKREAAFRISCALEKAQEAAGE